MSGIRVRRGTKAAVRQMYTMVLCVSGPDDGPELGAALAAFVSRWTGPADGEHDAPSLAVGPLVTPAGSFLLLDVGKLSETRRAALVDELVRELEDAGVVEAEISGPPGSRLWPAELAGSAHLSVAMGRDWGPSCYAVVYPGPRGYGTSGHTPLPTAWIDIAITWMNGFGHHDATVILEGAIDLDVPLLDLADLMKAGLDTTIVAIVGDPRTFAAAVGINPFDRTLSLAVGGTDLSAGDAETALGSLTALAGSLEGAVYGIAGFDHRWTSLVRGYHVPPEQQRTDGERSTESFPFIQPTTIARFVDEVAVDAAPWQLLTTGHIERLGNAPEGATPLDEGRWQLLIGTAEQWWPNNEPAPMLSQARSAIRTLLLTKKEANEYGLARYARRHEN